MEKVINRVIELKRSIEIKIHSPELCVYAGEVYISQSMFADVDEHIYSPDGGFEHMSERFKAEDLISDLLTPDNYGDDERDLVADKLEQMAKKLRDYRL